MMLRNFFMLAACALLVAAGIVRADTSPIPAADYTVSRSWRLGGSTGWDYLALDATGARLFVTREERIHVAEPAGAKPTGSITHRAGLRGVPFAPTPNRGLTRKG